MLEGLACRQAALRGLTHDTVAVLRNCLDEGDRILGKGVLLPEDHLPYQRVNITLHNRILEAAGVIVLEHEVAHLEINGVSVGIAGAKGFGGGFRGGCASTFGEREMRQFLAPTIAAADFFQGALRSLDTDLRLALMHYAPIPDTLIGERWELFPFLGAQQLGEALDHPAAGVRAAPLHPGRVRDGRPAVPRPLPAGRARPRTGGRERRGGGLPR